MSFLTVLAAESVDGIPTITLTPPRPALTIFGPAIELVTRSYAPFDSFGGGFEGDNRGPSTDSKARARVTSIARIDTNTNKVTFSAFSNESAWPALPFKYDQYSYWPAIIPHLQATATAVPTVRGSSTTNGNDTMTILMSHAGAMPLTPGAVTPDIDLHTTFTITLLMGASISVVTTMTGDAFPNAEAFARFGDGSAVMLHHFETSAGTDGPFYMLPGDNNRPMGSTTVTIPPPKPKTAVTG